MFVRVPLCVFLQEKLGTQGMGALLRYPPIVEISPLVLQKGIEILTSAGATAEECAFFLRKFPELFVRFSTVFVRNNTSVSTGSQVRGEELAVAEVGGAEGSVDVGTETSFSSSRLSEEQVEQVLFHFRALKTVSSGGWDVKIAETELRMLLEALEKRNIDN